MNPSREGGGPVRRALSSTQEDAAVLLGLLVVAVAATWPLAAHLATTVPGDLGDPLEYAWMMGWGAHAVTAQPLALFDANMFFPSDVSLAFSENLLGLAVPLAPLTRLTGNAVLATNVAVLVSMAVGGYGLYRLVLALGGGRLPALVAAVAFTVAPFRVASITHVHVLALHLLPFALLAFVRLVRRPSRGRAVVLALVLAAQLWTSLSGGLLAVLCVALGGAWALLADRREAVRAVALAAGATAGAVLLAVPALLAYREALRENPSYKHPEIEAVNNSATLGSYLYPNAGSRPVRRVYKALAARTEPARARNEKTLFPGLGLCLAAGAGLAGVAEAATRRHRGQRRQDHDDDVVEPGRRWPRSPLVLVGMIGGAGLLLSLGPRWGARPDGPRLPFALLAEAVGGLSRAPARYGVLVIFALALTAGLTLGRLPRLPQRLVLGACALLLALEAFPGAVEPQRVPDLNAAHRSLAGTGRHLLVLPTMQLPPEGGTDIVSIVREARILWLSTAHFRPMVNGYGAFLPEPYVDVAGAVQDFPSAAGLDVLHRLGIDTVVVEGGLVGGTPWEAVGERLRATPGARLVTAARGTEVWDVAGASMPEPAPAPAVPAPAAPPA